MKLKHIRSLTFISFSICCLQANQAAVAPLSTFIDSSVNKQIVLKRKTTSSKKINFNCKYQLNHLVKSESAWKSINELDLDFMRHANGSLNDHNRIYTFAKNLPGSAENVDSKLIFEKVSLGYLEEFFSAEDLKASIERMEPSMGLKNKNSSFNFKIRSFHSQAEAVYKSDFQAKVIFDFDIQNSEFVLQKDIAKNTALSLNLKNSDIDNRQTVNLALRW